MVGKLLKAGLLVCLLSAVVVGAVSAEEELHPPRIRVIGEITGVDLENASFNFHTRSGKDLRFHVNDRTSYRSESGTIMGFEDLEPGMFALVVATGTEDEGLYALLVAVGDPSDQPSLFKANGIIKTIDLDQSSFSIETSKGENIRFAVTDRTRFKSRDGSITSLADLEPGIAALVAALKPEGGLPEALLVAAGQAQERPHRIEVAGEITNVIPGQDTFEIHTLKGDDLSFTVVERTVFRSPDASVDDIYDLKAGMKAYVVGVKGEDGSLTALGIAVGQREDRPGRDPIDLKAAGEIISIGDRSFTVRTFHQGELTFSVDGSTTFKSRGGRVDSFDDLETGMYVVVGAKELGSGELKALIVGVGQPQNDRAPRSTDRPDQDRPERAPVEGSDSSI